MKTLTINVHFKCNAKCIFCVVGIPENQQSANDGFSYEEIVEELRRGREEDCEILCLSGGEPTLYKHICNVIKTAKEMGYKSIEMKTNGIKLANFDFVKELKEAGLDIFCISLQGHTAEIHDFVVGVPGAFDLLIKAAENVKSVGGILYTPTCIQTSNYQFLPEIARLYKKISSDIICPTFIEPNGSADENFNNVVPRIENVLPYLHKALEIIEETQIAWSLHGFPLCTIREYAMKSLDVSNNRSILAGSKIDNYSNYEREMYRCHGPECKNCTLYMICNGVWKQYAERYGFSECIPIGDSIVDVIPAPILINSIF